LSLALSAEKLLHGKKLPMADSIILATAQAHGAELLTQDNDFEGIDGVLHFKKSTR
jgi:predicted nucleic acid-binding protein